MKFKKCLICKEELYSRIGKSCRMCGMVLEEKGLEFCCEKCRIKYHKINFKGGIK